MDDLSALVDSLNAALSDIGFAPIGKAGSGTKFDKTLHRAVGKGARSVQDGDSVNVRYVGYERDGKVVVKAHVTAA